MPNFGNTQNENKRKYQCQGEVRADVKIFAF